jgi:hypothetical protein
VIGAKGAIDIDKGPTALGESRGYAASGLRDVPPADVLKSRTFPADYVKKPDPKAHAVNARAGTLVSSMAVAPNGRLWATWYCGITPAEDQNNYVVLSTSADDGKTWQEVFVADPDGTGVERPFDPEVWVAPDGSLRWIWADRICRDLAGRKNNAYPDILMMSTIPDANVVPAEPPQPRPIAEGVMMCKPTVLRDGTWAFPAAKWGGKDLFERSYVTEKVVSASGAGDTSIAGFLAGILHGESPEDSLHIASAAGALSVTEYDAVSALMPLADIKAKIKAGWNKIG